MVPVSLKFYSAPGYLVYAFDFSRGSLVVHVPAGEAASSSQRIVRIFHTKRNKEITRMSYSSSVLAVRMNRKNLVVLIETAIYIYDITNMHLLHTISSTPPNPAGLPLTYCSPAYKILAGICALASCYVNGDPKGVGTNSFFAYPGNDATGEVFVYDVANMVHLTVT
jgi:hypothetical protein